MTTYYESITASATDAIEAMAERPRDTVLCPAAEVQALAAYVFFSWLQGAGKSAKHSDAKKMTDLIVGML
jgi:hypothetical protein